METKEVVLDASVIVKWFSQEESHDKAIKIRDDFLKGEMEIVLPDLILYELSNALRFNPVFDFNDVKEAVGSILDMDLTITSPTSSVLNESIRLAFSKNITVYDAIYISLASNLNYILVTADKKLYNKVKDLGFVFLLEELN